MRILMNALSVGEHQLGELPKGRIDYLLGQFFMRMGRPHDAVQQPALLRHGYCFGGTRCECSSRG